MKEKINSKSDRSFLPNGRSVLLFGFTPVFSIKYRRCSFTARYIESFNKVFPQSEGREKEELPTATPLKAVPNCFIRALKDSAAAWDDRLWQKFGSSV